MLLRKEYTRGVINYFLFGSREDKLLLRIPAVAPSFQARQHINSGMRYCTTILPLQVGRIVNQLLVLICISAVLRLLRVSAVL